MLGFLLFAVDTFAEPVKAGHVTAELIAEVSSFQPGQPFWVGLRLEMDDHWHVYWRNAGDAGTPPEIFWNLPQGFSAESIQWPIPEKIQLGPLTNYGYHDNVIFPIKIIPPESANAGEKLTLSAKAEWLVCKEVCIPGSANLALNLTVSDDATVYNNSDAALINTYREKVPTKTEDWNFGLTWTDNDIIIELYPPDWYQDDLADLSFYPFERGVISYSAVQKTEATDGHYRLTVERDENIGLKPDTLNGILLNDSGWRGPDSEKAIEVSLVHNNDINAVAAVSDISSFWTALLFAFIGGIILNLMPCVLPVLSLKILGFVQQAQESRAKSFGHGLTFTAGVLISFWILVGALLVLQATGESIGWGFQLQSPEFLMILSGFIFLFGLNMLGVFEIGTSLTGVGAESTRKNGWAGSFMNGVTATIVATPCTAPFMGSALGYSLAQPPLISIMIFTALALGMSSPYIILSAFPRLLKFLPKPGAWMNTLKQVMGFLLIATVIWLAWVLSIQAGAIAVVALLAVMFMLGLGAWILGKWGTLVVSTGKRMTAWALFATVLIIGLGFGLFGVSLSTPAEADNIQASHGLNWGKFTPELVQQKRSEGKPVFIDFTAAWCLSCQVNERVAFGSREVLDRFKKLGVVSIKADWTTRDASITKALAEFGRNSVPLYVLYGPGSERPIILPEIITPDIVLNALEKIE